MTFVLIFIALKFVLTILSYSAGVPGGLFAPLLLPGVLTGMVFGQISTAWFPAMEHAPTAFAVVGMVAIFAAVVQAPLTGIVLIQEMTGSYSQLLHLLTACSIAYLVAMALRSRPIYDALMDMKQTHGHASV